MTRTSIRQARVGRAFKHRNYRLFWFGQLISLIGTWMQSVAQGWLVLQLSGDPLILGVVTAAQFLPVMILGLFGGVIADQLPKRQTLIVTQAVQMLLAFVLWALVITGTVQVWMIVVLAFGLGCANAFDMPVRQSFVVEMVGREDVANAVALNSAVFNGARVVGPAVAGILIGLVGMAACFFLNGVSFIAVIVGLAMMRDSELFSRVATSRPKTVAAVRDSLMEGLRYVRRTPAVLLPISVVGLVSTFAINFGVSVPEMVRTGLNGTAADYGFLMAATGLGCVVSALVLAATGRASVTVLLSGALVLSILFTAFGVSQSFAVSLVLMFGVGVGLIAMAASANTLIQLMVPDRLRGRVMSVYTTVFAGSTPVGGLATGALASAIGISAAIVLTGLVSVLTVVGAIVYAFRHPAVAQRPVPEPVAVTP